MNIRKKGAFLGGGGRVEISATDDFASLEITPTPNDSNTVFERYPNLVLVIRFTDHLCVLNAYQNCQ